MTGGADSFGLTVVMPVYNDWESAALLLPDIAAAFASKGAAIDVLMVDDGSIAPPPESFAVAEPIRRVECLRLVGNVGHQRAIAIGLTELSTRADGHMVAVMDSDGEDRPEELARLVDLAHKSEGQVVVAQRSRRSEGLAFRLFYRLYVWTFRFLTGQRINFGNFSVLPRSLLRRVVADANIWNNFPAAIVRSKVPILYVPTQRGRRYVGTSHMNLVSLVGHGLGAISVFTEAVFVRVLLFSALLLVFSAAISGVTLFLKLFTTLAVPTWATTVLGFALVISIQALMMPVLMAFMLLNARSTVQQMPSALALQLVAERLRIRLVRSP